MNGQRWKDTFSMKVCQIVYARMQVQIDKEV